jgi:hypothetical protein
MKNIVLTLIFSVLFAFTSLAASNSGLNLPGGKKSKKCCKTEEKSGCNKEEKKSCCPSKTESKEGEGEKKDCGSKKP